MIPVRNIYYMLAYAFQVLNGQGYKDLAVEDFDNVADLCAAILIKGVSIQVKRGLVRDYIVMDEALSSPRGKIDISTSIKSKSFTNKKLICRYDDFSENCVLNQILKTTMQLLLHAEITKSRKKELRKLLVFFANTDELALHDIKWNIRYDRNNQTYRMLVSVCYLVIKGLLQTNSNGSVRMMNFLDEQRMCRLYEKFILNYYRREFPQISANASQIPWALDDGMSDLLPVMQSDIMLSYADKILIIDAKYYSHTTQVQFGVNTLHSNNLYQIFTYVKNKESAYEKGQYEISGMLLYAGTDEIIQPDKTYKMSGNKISVKTLDLNQNFPRISSQLDEIAISYFHKTAV